MGGTLRIAYELLVNDRCKFSALLIGISFAVFLMVHAGSLTKGNRRTFSLSVGFLLGGLVGVFSGATAPIYPPKSSAILRYEIHCPTAVSSVAIQRSRLSRRNAMRLPRRT